MGLHPVPRAPQLRGDAAAYEFHREGGLGPSWNNSPDPLLWQDPGIGAGGSLGQCPAGDRSLGGHPLNAH